MGGRKPSQVLLGRPLISYPIAAAHAAGLEPIVVSKRSRPPRTDLARVLWEPEEPTHPLNGIVTALNELEQTIVVCPCDLPLLGPTPLAYLAETAPVRRPRLLEGEFGLEPLLGTYPPQLAPRLAEAMRDNAPSHRTALELGAEGIALDLCGAAPDSLLNVNDPDGIAVAERLLAARAQSEERT